MMKYFFLILATFLLSAHELAAQFDYKKGYGDYQTDDRCSYRVIEWFDCCLEIESITDPNFELLVKSSGKGNLQFKLDNGDWSVVNSTDPDQEYCFRDLIGSYYLIQKKVWDRGEFILLSKETGKEFHILGLPHLSPNGKRFFDIPTFNLDSYFSPRRIEIWAGARSTGLTKEWSKEFYFKETKWLDDQTISIDSMTFVTLSDDQWTTHVIRIDSTTVVSLPFFYNKGYDRGREDFCSENHIDNSYQCASEIEFLQLPKHKKIAQRKGDLLQCRLLSGKKVDFEDEAEELFGGYFTFQDYIEIKRISYFLIQVHVHEAEVGLFYLMDSVSGRKFETLSEPYFSPNKDNFFSCSLKYGVGTRFELWETKIGNLVKEASFDFEWNIWSAKWFDNNTIGVRKAVHTKSGYDIKGPSVIIRRSGATWVVRE